MVCVGGRRISYFSPPTRSYILADFFSLTFFYRKITGIMYGGGWYIFCISVRTAVKLCRGIKINVIGTKKHVSRSVKNCALNLRSNWNEFMH